MKKTVCDAIGALSKDQQFVLLCRAGIDGRKWTLEEIGYVIGVSRERIRQIESKALRIVRKATGYEEADIGNIDGLSDPIPNVDIVSRLLKRVKELDSRTELNKLKRENESLKHKVEVLARSLSGKFSDSTERGIDIVLGIGKTMERDLIKEAHRLESIGKTVEVILIPDLDGVAAHSEFRFNGAMRSGYKVIKTKAIKEKHGLVLAKRT